MARTSRRKLDSGKYKYGYEGPDRRWHYKTYERREAAERWLRDHLTAMDRGEWIDPRVRRTSVAEFGERWLESTTHLKPKTREGYESLLRLYVIPEFGRWRISDVTRASIRSWLSGLLSGGLSPSRTRQARSVLSQVLEHAVDTGALRANPARGVRVNGNSDRVMLFLDASQVARLADEADSVEDGSGTLVYLLAFGGLRWGEAAALRRGRCDLLRSQIHVRESVSEVRGELHFGDTKTGKNRVIIVPGFLRDRLAAHMANDPAAGVGAFVFADSKEGPLRNSNWRHRVWRPACEAAGMPEGLRIHDLRHTAASLAVSAGANVKAVQRMLGHSTASQTLDRYSHLFTEDLEALADRLDAVFSQHNASYARPLPSDEVTELVG